MSSNSFGDNFRVTTFGESHGPALGVVIDGVRAGLLIDLEAIQREIDRRRPGQSELSTSRGERDRIELLSGVFEGRTTGAPIALLVRNVDARSDDYRALAEVFRPGHADITWWHKFGIRDWRGGGRSSGRETVARVAAGALARRLLAERGVRVLAHVVRVGDEVAESFDPEVIDDNAVRCADAAAADRMADAIRRARADGDSIGGVVEVRAEGVPAGWGDPVFDKLDARLGAALLSIGAVKGVEIGDGFDLARRRGSQSNDEITPTGFATNHMGGVLGGISTGAPIVARLAVKPTPSIAREQRTVDVEGRPRTLGVRGRHDPCICPRLVPVAEAMVALVLCDAMLRQQAIEARPLDTRELQCELAFCDAEIVRLLRRRGAVVAAQNRAGGEATDTSEAVTRARDDTAARAGLPETLAERLFALVDDATSEIATHLVSGRADESDAGRQPDN